MKENDIYKIKSNRRNSKRRNSKRRKSKRRKINRKSKRIMSRNKRLRGGVIGERCTVGTRNHYHLGLIKNSCNSSNEYCGGSLRNGSDWICRSRTCGIPGYQTLIPTGYGIPRPPTDSRGRSPSPAPPPRTAPAPAPAPALAAAPQPPTDSRGRSPSPAPPPRTGHPHPYHPGLTYAPGVGSDPESDDPDKREAGFGI